MESMVVYGFLGSIMESITLNNTTQHRLKKIRGKKMMMTMETKTKKNVPVFSHRVADQLINEGYQLNAVAPNRQVANHRVYYFEPTPNLKTRFYELTR